MSFFFFKIRSEFPCQLLKEVDGTRLLIAFGVNCFIIKDIGNFQPNLKDFLE